MEFEINDITQQRLEPSEFHKKYGRYFEGGILIDTAPLFLILVSKLSTNVKERLLREEFGYDLKAYEVLNTFLKRCGVDLDKAKITPQILQEVISHLQDSCSKLNNDEKKKHTIEEFVKTHLTFLNSTYLDISTWAILKDSRMTFIEYADISFLLCADKENHIALLTQDGDFHTEGMKHRNILAIDFSKVLTNPIPEEFS